VLGLLVVAVRSHLQIPAQVYEFLSIFLLLAIGLKGGVALRGAQIDEVLLPAALSVAFGILIPLAVYFVLKALTKLDSINRGALAAHYGSTSLVTFTAGLVFVEQAGLEVEAYLFTLLAIMEVPGIIIGIFLAKRAAMRNAFGPLMHEVFTGKSVVLLVGGIVIGAVAGSAGYQQVEPLFGGLFAGALTLFLLQLGIQAGKSIKDIRSAGFGLLHFCNRVSNSCRLSGCGICTSNRNERRRFGCLWSALRECVIHRSTGGSKTFASRSATWSLHHDEFGNHVSVQPAGWNSLSRLVCERYLSNRLRFDFLERPPELLAGHECERRNNNCSNQ
jgi:hypothetical protein